MCDSADHEPVMILVHIGKNYDAVAGFHIEQGSNFEVQVEMPDELAERHGRLMVEMEEVYEAILPYYAEQERLRHAEEKRLEILRLRARIAKLEGEMK